MNHRFNRLKRKINDMARPLYLTPDEFLIMDNQHKLIAWQRVRVALGINYYHPNSRGWLYSLLEQPEVFGHYNIRKYWKAYRESQNE